MTAEGQTNWSPEQLEEWAKPALEYLELVLVEIARTATRNNQAKKEALEWVAKTHEDLGQACRWARILRVEHPERFEKLVYQVAQKPKQEEKKMAKGKMLRTGDIDGYLKYWKDKLLQMKKGLRYPNGSLNVEAVKYSLTELEKMKEEIEELLAWHRGPSFAHPL